MKLLARNLAAVLCAFVLSSAQQDRVWASNTRDISLNVQGASLADVLQLIAVQGGRNILADDSLNLIHVTTHLDHVSFEEALAVMTQAYGLVIKRRQNVIIINTAASERKRYEDLAASDEHVTTVKLRYARASDAVKHLMVFLPPKNFSADVSQNAILLVGTGPMISRAKAALREIDVLNQQVSFEVKVVDVTVDQNSDVGLIFGGSSTAPGTTGTAFRTRDIPLYGTLNALVTKGRAKILATPRIVTTNNNEAHLLIGQSYPLVTTVIENGVAVQDVKYYDIGVKLRVTPTIGVDGSILADLHPEYSSFEATSQQGYPIISNRRVDSILRVQNGESIVLAGLLEDIDQNTITKIPVLGDIPILGGVFRNRIHMHHHDELVFIITPHVL